MVLFWNNELLVLVATVAFVVEEKPPNKELEVVVVVVAAAGAADAGVVVDVEVVGLVPKEKGAAELVVGAALVVAADVLKLGAAPNSELPVVGVTAVLVVEPNSDPGAGVLFAAPNIII